MMSLSADFVLFKKKEKYMDNLMDILVVFNPKNKAWKGDGRAISWVKRVQQPCPVLQEIRLSTNKPGFLGKIFSLEKYHIYIFSVFIFSLQTHYDLSLNFGKV